MPSLNAANESSRSHPALIVIVLLTICASLPYFATSVVPFHDASYVLECFHCLYSGILLDGELMRWFPYGQYGLTADFYQLALPPTLYVVGLLGCLSGTTDTLLLFKLAMLINELLFALGLYLLCRELYSLKSTCFLVSVGGMLAVSWLEQSMFNFMIYYLLPLVMYLTLRFFKTGNPTFLFLAGAVEVSSLLGNVLYIAPLHFWALATFGAPLALEHRHSLRQLVRLRTALNPGLWGFAVAALVIVLFARGAFEHLKMMSQGRDLATGKVPLDTFLNFGRPLMATAICGTLTGGIPHGPNTYYVGLLPLALFGYALFTERSKVFLGLAAACLTLLWLTIGGSFASIYYHLPGMGIYRHIALIYGIVGVMLLLGAGFGMERLVDRRADGQRTAGRPIRWQRWVVVVTFCLMLADLLVHRGREILDDPHLHPHWTWFFVFRVLVYAVGLAALLGAWRSTSSSLFATRRAMAFAVLGGACLLDLASFRLQVMLAIPTVEQVDAIRTAFRATRIPYREYRNQDPVDDRGRAALDVLLRPFPPYNNAQYGVLCTFSGIDPCRPLFRADVMAAGVYEMIRARGGQPILHPDDNYLPAGDDAFRRSLGCGTPKLRLVGRAIEATDDAQATQLFTALTDPDQTIVLSPGPGQSSNDLAQDSGGGSHHVEVVEFTSNRLQARVRVDGTVPRWLLYADAWHPAWQARIDGNRGPVRRANLGFKAVRVDPGVHEVEFVYGGRKRTLLAWLTAAVGLASGLGLCATLVVCCLPSIDVRTPGASSRARQPAAAREPSRAA